MVNNSINDSCSIYNDSDYVIVAALNAAVAFLSLLACIFGLTIVILFKKWKFFNQRLVVYLIIAATLEAIATIIHRVDYGSTSSNSLDGFCRFTGFLSQLTVWMILNAITSITVYLFLLVVCDRFTEKFEVAYILFIFVFPFTFSWIPFINDTYGRAGVWCWIRTIDIITCERLNFGVVLQLVLFYVPMFSLLLILVIFYLVILCKLQWRKRKWKDKLDEHSRHSDKVVRKEIISLLAYPVICIVLFLPLVATRIQSWIKPENPSIALWYLSGILYPFIGTIIVLAFTLDSDTRRRLNWAHVRAAVRDYHTRKVVTEYVVGVATSEGGEDVPYKQLTDNTVVETLVEQ